MGTYLKHIEHKFNVLLQSVPAASGGKVTSPTETKVVFDRRCFKYKPPEESSWDELAKTLKNKIYKQDDKDCTVSIWRTGGKVKFPPYGICPHTKAKDPVVSGAYWKGGQWEPDTTEALFSLLQLDPCAGFINIGANIGAHVFPLARQGYQVLAVEATKFNADRVRASIALNGFQDRITLLHAAISDRTGSVTMKIHPQNAGATFIERNRDPGLGWIGALPRKDTIASENASSLILNDLVDLVPFRVAVLKVDIESFECYILRSNKVIANDTNLPENSERFFKDINIRAIILEFATVHDKQGVHAQCLSNMMDDLYRRGFLWAWNWPKWDHAWDPRRWRENTKVGYMDLVLTKDKETSECCKS